MTHSSMNLTSVKMMEGEDQQKEPDLSGCAFLGQEPDSVKKVDEEFCDYVNKHDCGLWYKIEETSFGYFLANSQQTKCTGKLVVHMYDKSWSVHTTEFDIVEEGTVPLLMSLPQMRKLGFQFLALTTEVIPELHQTRNLETPAQDVKEHSPIVMDFQDIPWYMSAVYFKTPDVQSFFSEFEHFECSQLSAETLLLLLMMTRKLTTTGRN